MIRQTLTCLALTAVLAVAAGTAEAVTIDGVDYNLALSSGTNDHFGYWRKQKKFKPAWKSNDLGFDNVTFLDEALADADLSSIFVMGTTTTKSWEADIASGNLSIFDSTGAVLLSAEYASNGFVDVIPKKRERGQFDLAGVFNVTGGSLFDQDIITGSIYLELFFNYVNSVGSSDLKASQGTINLYTSGGTTPPAEVPEPASVLLLSSSLMGLAARRRRRN